MRRRTKVVASTAAAVAVVGAGGFLGVAAATGGDEVALTGQTRERAVAAALAHVGGGEITETVTGDQGAAYEVEVRRAEGSQVEVRLDDGFSVIGQERDDDGPGDRDGGADDR